MATASAGRLAFLIGLAAFNLRPGITTMGPVLGRIRADLDLSGPAAGALTSIPLLAFAVCALLASGISRRLQATTGVALGAGLIAVGLAFRVFGNEVTLLSGTIVGSAGIAVVAVLLPVVVRTHAVADSVLMTTVFTASLQFGAALGFIMSVPLADALGGWRPGLFVWCLPAVAAAVMWFRLPGGIRTAEPQADDGDYLSWRGHMSITVFFGLQAAVAFVVIGWLPSVLLDAHVPSASVGAYMGLLAALAVPVSLVLPHFARLTSNLSAPILLLTVCSGVGLLGLALVPATLTVIWVALLGVGLAVFSLAIMAISTRGKDLRSTARLSAVVQGGGYLLAAPAPVIFGAIRDSAAGWRVPMLALLCVVVIQAVVGGLAGSAVRTRHTSAR